MAKSSQQIVPRAEHDGAEDPFMIQFDKGVALLGYGLLLVSPFMLGLPALASLALAFAHRHDAHPVILSHYRFQGALFWTIIGLLVLALALLLVGGGVEMTTVAGFIQAHLGGLPLPAWLVGGYGDKGERETGNWMLAGGITAVVVALLWLVIGSIWGAFKLVLGRPMGLRR